MSKNKIQKMTIFASSPTYFDALKTNMNSKNWKSNILWSFWLFCFTSFTLPVLWPKWPEYVTFSFFWVHICFQRIEIRRRRCKYCHFLDFYFRHFIYFLKIMQMFINRELQSFKIYFKNRSINGKNLVKLIGKWLRECKGWNPWAFGEVWKKMALLYVFC